MHFHQRCTHLLLVTKQDCICLVQIVFRQTYQCTPCGLREYHHMDKNLGIASRKHTRTRPLRYSVYGINLRYNHSLFILLVKITEPHNMELGSPRLPANILDLAMHPKWIQGCIVYTYTVSGNTHQHLVDNRPVQKYNLHLHIPFG